MLQHHGQVLILIVMDNGLSHAGRRANFTLRRVLILIVMDNGLSRWGHPCRRDQIALVLILIVMDNGLSLRRGGGEHLFQRQSLNPYCNG